MKPLNVQMERLRQAILEVEPDQQGQLWDAFRQLESLFGSDGDVRRRREEALKAGEARILESIAKGAPLSVTLEQIAKLVEEQAGDMIASILLLEAQGRISVGAAPSMPESYNRAIAGEPIGPVAGSCGTAMFLRRTVLTSDIATDPLWDRYRDVALNHGLRSSWSTPLFSTTGQVLGSLAQYYREPRDPTPDDLQLVDIAKHLAEIAIERSQAEESLYRQTQDLERANRSLKEMAQLQADFVKLVSHELRTPLSSIRGYTEFLEEGIGGALTPEQASFVTQIQKGTLRLQSLVDDLLDFARMDAGTFRLKPEHVDLLGTVRSALEGLRPQAQARGLHLEASLPERPVVAFADPGRVLQVLTNLVGNALKFTPPGGRVGVSVMAQLDAARIEVRDSGIGIAPAHLPHLFERFFQVDASDTRPVGGAGLGLSISKALVEAHGGRIGVESSPGQGTLFWFTLPGTPRVQGGTLLNDLASS